MAQFKPFKVSSSQLDSLPIVDGQFIIVSDTNQVYCDVSPTERILLIEEEIKDYIDDSIGDMETILARLTDGEGV